MSQPSQQALLPHQRRVVITGAGNVSSLGTSWEEVKSRLQGTKSAVRYMPEWEQYEELKTKLAAPIDDFELPPTYRAKKKRSMGKVAQMAVRATEIALEDAGLLGHEAIKDGSTGIAYGSAYGNFDASLEFFSFVKEQSMNDINTTTYIRMMSHTAPVNIGVYFGIKGRMYTTSSACTAGSQGVGYAFEAIRAGQQEIMVTGGSEELMPAQAAIFDTIFAASLKNDTPEKSPRAFDVDRDGLVLGEGATTLILESYDHAIARGANILAEIIGFGTNTDGAHIVRPQQKTMEKVMELALADANVTPEQIGYISAHATATEYGDIAESLATFNVMGKKPISTLKGFTGHSLGACAAFELWSTINMMNEGWFAANLNLDNIDSRCADLDYIQHQPRQLETDIVMSNNFAFGGINTSLIVKKCEA